MYHVWQAEKPVFPARHHDRLPGAAVQPSEGRIVAPANGTVDMMFDTGHAVSMTTSEGAELLIHVGIDTVNLKGQHYTAKCKSGDTVRKGDTLLKISRQIYGRDDEIDAICSLNGIEDSDRILEGQKLLLP